MKPRPTEVPRGKAKDPKAGPGIPPDLGPDKLKTSSGGEPDGPIFYQGPIWNIEGPAIPGDARPRPR